MPKKFLRRDSNRHSKLGHLRKKLQKWRRPTGRDNKMREKRRGYPKIVSIGYSKDKSLKKSVIIIRNIKDLDKVKDTLKGTSELVIIGAVGKKKKIEIIKKAKEMKINLRNVNEKKFLKKAIKKPKTPKGVLSSTKKKDLSEEGKKVEKNKNKVVEKPKKIVEASASKDNKKINKVKSETESKVKEKEVNNNKIPATQGAAKLSKAKPSEEGKK